VLDGLEQVRMMPAATGGRRTVISFGPGDRRGLKGPDVMVRRAVSEGQLVSAGRSGGAT
jgi:branched-chain amino acid transport system substrate-binding protein